MTSIEYEGLDQPTQQRFTDRFGAMYDALIQLNALQLEPPKTTLQLKATTSAPVAAKILARTGVQTTPDEVAEPPLDTWVTEDLADPVAHASGNTQADQMQQAQAMQQSADTHQVQIAKAAHEAALAEHHTAAAQQQSEQAAREHALEQSRAEELHAAKLHQMQQRPAAPSGRK